MIQKTRSRRGQLLALGAALAVALLAHAGAGGAAEEPPPLRGVVNVNTASVEELQLLPGIGESRARALIEERKRRGGFTQVEQLLEVKGIGGSSLERMRPFVRLSGKTTAQRP